MSFPSRKSGPNYEFGRVNSGTGKVPNAQKPKARPPRGVRDRIGGIASSLPPYSGPYGVGLLDIEVPARKPRTFSQITRKKQHILRLETVLMTIYYPSAFDVGRGQDPGGHKQWSRQTWLPRPRLKSAQGYGIFAGVGSLGVPWFALTTMLTKLPAYRNAPLATHWPAIRDSSQSGGRNPDCEAGPPPTGESDMPVFPMLILSHGLGGTRTAYSSVCGEFASYGFIVCALEHRDGSGPRTYVNHAPAGIGSMEEREKTGNIEHNQEQKERGYDIIDYIFPHENHKDTDPNNEKGHDRELRGAQTEMRMAEIEEAYHIMRMIANGDGAAVADMNLRRKGFVGSSSRGLDGVDWSLWKGRFNCDHTTMAGHSFGAATTVEILRNNKRFPYISQGIIFDIWGATVNPLTDDSEYRIKVPIIGLNSEAFMYWPENFSAVSSLIDEAKSQGLPAWLLTVRGTVHLSHSDFPTLYPITCAVTQRMTANPKRALDININACLEFLQLTLPTSPSSSSSSSIIERAMDHEGILDVDLVDDVPTLHKPPQKYIAVRLEVPHQFRSRVIPKATRKFKRAMNTPDLSDEVWSHARPHKDELQRYIEKKNMESD